MASGYQRADPSCRQDHQRPYTYAIGDLHGEVTLLCRLLERLALGAGDRLIFLGDYLDRGEDSLGTVERLTQISQRHHCVFLRGNHDAEWLEQWNGERFRRRPAIPGARALWEQYRGLVPPQLGHFLAKTVLCHEDEDAWYAHAGAQPGVPLRQTPPHVLLWGAPEFLTTDHDWGKLVVCGHYELAQPLVTRTKVCLDTAAYRTGSLTAMRMHDRALVEVCRSPDSAVGDEATP